MLILGINAYHGDSSACLAADGRLICAIEEERIRRIKHWAGLPTESIRWCLDYAGIGIKDIDAIAISRNPYARLHKKIFRIIRNAYNQGFIKSRLQNVSKIAKIKNEIAKSLEIDPARINAKIYNVEHHRAHIGSTFLVSPFEKAVCVTIDGFGDFLSAMRGIGVDNKVDITDVVEYPHSLGIFYTAFTQFLGFWKYGDEYKVMGLSALGEPDYTEKMKRIIRLKGDGLFDLDTTYFLHDTNGVEMTWLNSEPQTGKIFSDRFLELFGRPREKDEGISKGHADIAASMQGIYEEVFFYILNDIYEKTKVDKICLAGGCIQNSLANGKIFKKTPFKEVYIPPAAHDAGTAIGAAFWVWNVVLGNKRDFVMDSPYWGPEFSEGEVEKILKLRGSELKDCTIVKVENEDKLCKKTAKEIAEGKIVGWFQGKMEWGPRALGNRSIVVDPRRAEMKEVLNSRIKRREPFRPFAPSILLEKVGEYFERDYPDPFMIKVYPIRSEKQGLIPAVTHVDGTGRLQTVRREDNPLYWQLIKEFENLTGVPVVLNTSFNENEPIVCTPAETLDCFLRTKMDVLALGNFFIRRQTQNHKEKRYD